MQGRDFGNVMCGLLTTLEGLSGTTASQASFGKLKLAVSIQFIKGLRRFWRTRDQGGYYSTVLTREILVAVEHLLESPRKPGGTRELRAKTSKCKEPFGDSGPKPAC